MDPYPDNKASKANKAAVRENFPEITPRRAQRAQTRPKKGEENRRSGTRVCSGPLHERRKRGGREQGGEKIAKLSSRSTTTTTTTEWCV